VAEAIGAAGGSAHWALCDVADEASVVELARVAVDTLGSVDILVNNAGVGHSALLVRETLEDWNRTLAVNATGSFLCARAFLPGMLERGWGRVVNVASVAGRVGSRYTSAYAASKHAVLGMTRSAAAEMAGTGVTVNAVCPGYVNTPMTDGTLEQIMGRSGMTRDDALEAMLATLSQKRLVEPDEVGDAVLYLCGQDAGSVNGQALVIDGGALLA
jgi:NAD(P)-dependent dehydrogenase (short-subunit alcohol dehydrogenase family)